MSKVIFVLALIFVAGFASTARLEELKVLWNAWKSIHGKTYTAGEDSARFAIFMDNYKFIIQHNSEGHTSKMGLNKFADLTSEEFKNQQAGCAFPEDLVHTEPVFNGPYSYPASVDWRQKGAVTPVKNQGQCGSCWTFSTTGVIEGFYAITHDQLLSFSEQQIVDCAHSAGYGCSGGWPYLAIEYAAQEGLEQEADYPYTGQDGTCQYQASKAVKAISGYTFVGTKSVDALKTAISTMPVSVLIEADQQVFQFYTSGVLSSGCGANLDHAVLAVGYDAGSFIVKNSWASSWGDQGYVYISDDASANGGAGVCGILSQPVIPH